MKALAILALVLPLLGGEVPPTLRLPATVQPRGYAVELTIVPEGDTFEGTVDIDVQVGQASRTLWLNAAGLTVTAAAFAPAHGRPIAASPRQAGEDFLALDLDRPAPRGRGRLHLRYGGRMTRRDAHGLLTAQEDGRWYAHTQFEAIAARQVIPCFDEPSYKVPWRVTLRIPRDDLAFSNTPQVSETPLEGGLKAVRFAPTRPLPSYLVAVAVGPFDVVDAGRAGRKGTPIRIIVPRGHAREAAFAAQAIPQLFTRLEDYFGIPYPYEKLDHLAAPLKTFSMENAGLITYGMGGLLPGAGEPSLGFQRACASLAAHEMAHQWFGDLVTMDWWHNLWLNEAFATWMAARINREWQPGWRLEDRHLASREQAMGLDSLVSARMIRQPIRAMAEIEDAFDAITYQKGSVVIGMFEAFMGPDAFRRGVRRYLGAHAYGTGTTGDFLQALAGQGDPRLPAAFSTFLDQGGLPVVEAALAPEGRGAVLHLTQRRFLPAGSEGGTTVREARAPSSPASWRIPLSLRYAVHGRPVTKRLLMGARAMAVHLPVAPADLDYLLLNPGNAGYFRSAYRGDLLARLEAHGAALSVAERMGLVADADGCARAGLLTKGQVLALVPGLAADPDPLLTSALVALVQGVGNDLVPEASRPNYARFVQATFGARARALGFRARPGEDGPTRLLRGPLLALVASAGEDAGLRAQAGALARQWLTDRTGPDADNTDLILDLAAQFGDRPLFDALLGAVRTAKDQAETRRLLTALGSFDDPVLEEAALSQALDGALEPRLALRILTPGTRKAATRRQVFDFVKAHADAISARLPREFLAYLPRDVAAGFSDEADRTEVEAFFRTRFKDLPGAERPLAQALEAIHLAAVQKATQQASVGAFLARF